MTDKDKERIECAIRHIKSSLDVDTWAMEIAVNAMLKQLSDQTGKTCTDTISRQDAIDAVDKYNFNFPQYMERFATELRDAIKADIREDIEAIPSAQPEQRWIPCSERMPSEDGWYFITRNDRTTSVAFFNAHCKSSDRKWVGIRTPLAWLSLPDPYQEGEVYDNG